MSPQSMLCERILLTNDDGIDAPGMAVLEKIAHQLSHDVWIVAPVHDQSGTSHSLSLHSPLRLSERGAQRYAVTGTPGDCVALALGHLMKDKKPTLLLSGVNRGANLGTETVFSGTIGAAMTGMLMGITSFALSQAFTDRNNVPWTVAETRGAATIEALWKSENFKAGCLNINFPVAINPALPPLTFTRQGKGYLHNIDVISQRDPRDLEYFWLSLKRQNLPDAPETEAAILQQGGISVTQLGFDRGVTRQNG